VLVEPNGLPLAVCTSGANTPDAKLLALTLDAIVVARPAPAKDAPQHLCLDKDYDNPTGEAAAARFGYVPHIRRIGEEKLDEQGEKKHPAHRWVVERTFAWLSRCRAILIRYDKLADRYLAMMKLASAMLWVRRWHKLSQKPSLLK
jgi:putative transposase